MRYAVIAGRRRRGAASADSGSVTEALNEPMRRAARRTLADEDFERAASVYRAALANGRRDPVECVVEELHLSRSTAGRRIVEARRRGFLPPTEPRKARA